MTEHQLEQEETSLDTLLIIFQIEECLSYESQLWLTSGDFSTSYLKDSLNLTELEISVRLGIHRF